MFFLDSYCADLYPIIKIAKIIYGIIHFCFPISLVLFITIDFAKAVISNNEDVMKKTQGVAIKRLIYAVALFLVFSLVSFVMNVISDIEANDLAGNSLDTESWVACWKCTSKSDCKTRDNGGNNTPSKERTDKYGKTYQYSNSKIPGMDCAGGADDPDNYFKDPDTGNLYKWRCTKK